MNKHKILILSSLLIVFTVLISGCAVPVTGGVVDHAVADETIQEEALDEQAAEEEVVEEVATDEGIMMEAPILTEFTLLAGTSSGGGLAFFSQGGEVDGQANPVLFASVGDTVRITLINGDGMPHDIYIENLGVQSAMVIALGDQTVVEFNVTDSGEFVYFCSVPGHRSAGMEGTLVVAP
jgi:nitrite reductase (NO-forming)